jgi:iron complex outermembrane receptor protein
VNQSQCGEELDNAILIPNPDPPPNNFALSTIPAGLDSKLNDINTWAARMQMRLLPPDSDVEWLLNVHGGRIDQRGSVGQSIGTASGFFGSVDNRRYRDPDIAKEADRIATKLNVNRPPNTVCGRPGTPGRDECLEAYAERRQIAEGRLSRNLAGSRPLDTEPFKGSYNRDGHERQETYGGFLRADTDFDFGTIKSISSFDAYERSRFTDSDYSPNLIFEFKTEDHAWQFTQELVADGELEDAPVTWSLGGLYLMEEQNFDQETLGGSDIRGLKKRYVQETWSLGVFADVGWDLLDDLTLNGSIRYNWERKKFDVTIVRANNVCEDLINQMGNLRPGLPCEARVTRDAPTGTVELKYFFDDETSGYLKYTRGWKGPQLNAADGATNQTYTVAEPETIDALEVGFSAAWLDGLLELSGAFFWYNWEDYQVFLFTNDFAAPPQRIVQNASTAQLYGAELEADIEPLEGLNIVTRFGWLESKFLDFTDSGIRRIVIPGDPAPTVIVTEVPIDFTGNRLPNTPRFTVSGSVSYELDLGRFGVIIPRYDFSWTDDVFFDPSEGRGAPNNNGQLFLPEYTIGQKAYWLHAVRLTYRPPGGEVEVALWMRNVGDEVYKTLAFDASASSGLVGNRVGDPQTYGISVSTSF